MTHNRDPIRSDSDGISRRRMLASSIGTAVAGAMSFSVVSAAEKGVSPVVKHGRIRQSIVPWCWAQYWDVEQVVKVAKQLGLPSVELLDPKFFPLLKKESLDCAIGTIDMAPDPAFVKGFNNPNYHEKVIQATRNAIDACSAFGCKNVISFTGMSEGIPDDVGAQNCVDGYKKIIGYAEKKGVTLCLEMLNTRDDTHPMKGHPGYQGNHTEYCIDIIDRVGSPNLKLLFDVYHVQIMDGDVIRRIRKFKDYIGHVHVAGNPGRGELDDKQEIAYKPIMEALLEVGYKGYVAQEFIPTRDPLEGLTQAVTLCDV